MLHRRGVALHVTEWLTFLEHRKLVKEFEKKLSERPMPGHAPVTIAQLMEADVKESKELKCRGVAEAAPEAPTVVWTTEGRWPPVVACL